MDPTGRAAAVAAPPCVLWTQHKSRQKGHKLCAQAQPPNSSSPYCPRGLPPAPLVEQCCWCMREAQSRCGRALQGREAGCTASPTHAVLLPTSQQCSQLATSSTFCKEAPSNEGFQPTVTLALQARALHTGQVMPWSEITPVGYKTGVTKESLFILQEIALKNRNKDH